MHPASSYRCFMKQYAVTYVAFENQLTDLNTTAMFASKDSAPVLCLSMSSSSTLIGNKGTRGLRPVGRVCNSQMPKCMQHGRRESMPTVPGSPASSWWNQPVGKGRWGSPCQQDFLPLPVSIACIKIAGQSCRATRV